MTPADRRAMAASITRILDFGRAEAGLERCLEADESITLVTPCAVVLAVIRELEAAEAEWGRAADAVRELVVRCPVTEQETEQRRSSSRLRRASIGR